MYRFLFTPRWLAFHALVVLAIVAMVNLGFWQLRRLDERRTFNAEVSSRTELPPQPLDDVLVGGAAPDDLQWRAVTTSGRYLPDEQLLVVNRSQGGVAGELVVTPMALDDGRILLVQRGFQPLGRESAAAPSGVVDIVGRLRASQSRRTGQLSDPGTGELTEVQRVDIPRLAPQLPGPPVPMYVELVASTPAEASSGLFPVGLPELTEGPHLSYAVQWFVFSAAVVVGWVLAVRKSLNTRRGAGRPPAVDAPPEAVGAAPPPSSG